MGKENPKSRIINTFSADTRFGRAHFTVYDIFDPLTLLNETPLCTDRHLYYSKTTHNGVSVVYSHQREGKAELLLLSVSGGTQDVKDEIVKKFGDILGRKTDRTGWSSISPMGIARRDMFIWKVTLSKQ
jgi:hypothetical protein